MDRRKEKPPSPSTAGFDSGRLKELDVQGISLNILLRNSHSSFPSSLRTHRDSNSKHKSRPRPYPPLQILQSRKQKRRMSSVKTARRKSTQPLGRSYNRSCYSSKTKTQLSQLRSFNSASSLYSLSKLPYKVSDALDYQKSDTTVFQSITVFVVHPACPENSTVVPQGSSRLDKENQEPIPKEVAQPKRLSDSAIVPAASTSLYMRCKPWSGTEDSSSPQRLVDCQRGSVSERSRLGFLHSPSSVNPSSCSQSRNHTNADCPNPEEVMSGQHKVDVSSTGTESGGIKEEHHHTADSTQTVCTEERNMIGLFELLSVKSENEPRAVLETPVTAVNCSVTNTQPTPSLHQKRSRSDLGVSRRGSSSLSRSRSISSLSPVTSAENRTFRRAQSLPDMLLKSSFEEFTPDVSDETFRFHSSCPGLYQCSVTGLVFHMEGEGDVVYRIVPWDRKLLAQRHKRPAGPLFDIKCEQRSVCQLHLPHCHIRSTGGCDFLSVAHVTDDSVEFIRPHQITETHVIINITGFSGFGNVEDEDSPPVPVQALVLLFYKPMNNKNPTSFLNVLMLPSNIVLQKVQSTRKDLVGEEIYIETSSYCKLHPKKGYTLSTHPDDDSVHVQPTEVEFDCDNYDNYIPSFQLRFKTAILNIRLSLRDTKRSQKIWEWEVCLPSTGVQRNSKKSLLAIRSSFINSISAPALRSLLEKLYENEVMSDSERESVIDMPSRRHQACFVIDAVMKKGEDACSMMIDFFCEEDPFLCRALRLL